LLLSRGIGSARGDDSRAALAHRRARFSGHAAITARAAPPDDTPVRAWHPCETMSPVIPKDRRVDGPTSFGEEICHIVTEEAPDTALCGKDVTGWPWNPPWPYCVVCLDLLQHRSGGGA